MGLAREHTYLGQGSFNLPPLDRQRKYSPQDLELPIHGGDFHAGVSAVVSVSGDFFRRDRVKGLVRNRGIFEQARGAVLVVGECFDLRGKPRSAIREEIGLCELPNGRRRLAIANADFTLGERGLVRGLDLFSDALVGLLGALPDRFTFPGEPAPPDPAALVHAHRYAPALSAGHDIGRVVRPGKSTANSWFP